MRKKEYIHIHGLLAEVTEQMIKNEALPVELLSAYDELGTHPTSIHKSKQNHREAILALTSAIESYLTEAPTGSHEKSVNQ